jgi:hypothetical protein
MERKVKLNLARVGGGSDCAPTRMNPSVPRVALRGSSQCCSSLKLWSRGSGGSHVYEVAILMRLQCAGAASVWTWCARTRRTCCAYGSVYIEEWLGRPAEKL